MLKLSGESNTPREKIEYIAYSPGLKDTTDLEAGTSTVALAAQPSITAAQYSRVLALTVPVDSRLVVQRLAARLNVNITTLGTAAHLYCSVRVDVDDIDHELFSEDWTTAGSKLDVLDLHTANKPVLFNLLKDGAAHTFYFLFWANAAGQVQIDTVQLLYAVGSCGTDTGSPPVCIQLNHQGLIQSRMWTGRQGTGNLTARLGCSDETYIGLIAEITGSGAKVNLPLALIFSDLALRLYGTVATDLNYFVRGFFTLRSEQ